MVPSGQSQTLAPRVRWQLQRSSRSHCLGNLIHKDLLHKDHQTLKPHSVFLLPLEMGLSPGPQNSPDCRESSAQHNEPKLKPIFHKHQQ